jgi:hypothetical protein
MAKPKAPNGIRAEVNELKDRIRAAEKRIKGAQDNRAEENAVIAEEYTALEAKGIPRKAMAWALIYASWDADARAGFDVAYQIVREAIGVPMEDQLFDKDGKPNLKIKAVADAVALHAKNSEVKGGPEDEEGEDAGGEEVEGEDAEAGTEPDQTQEIAAAVLDAGDTEATRVH